MDTLFDDPEGKYRFRAFSSPKLSARIQSRKLLFKSVPDSNGDTQIMVMALLNTLPVDSQLLHIKIAPINDPPIPFPLLQPVNNDSSTYADVPIIFRWEEAHDVDEQELFYSLHIGNRKSLLTFEDIGRNWVELLPSEISSEPGDIFWYVTVTDGEFNIRSTETFNLTLLPSEAGSKIVPKEKESIYLGQNQPNPFNPTTLIPLKLERAAAVELRIFNIVGEPVKTLFDDYLEAGEYQFNWDGKNEKGIHLASGMYFYRLQAAGKTTSKKLILLN
ncbi:MAG: FlgD immunoglobulin-like domain containing protein [Calditrichota bacterium]